MRALVRDAGIATTPASVRAVLAALAVLSAQTTHAQVTHAWQYIPRVVVIASNGADSRLQLVDAAVAHWNRLLEEAGSGFRLGSPERVIRPVPDAALQERSRQVIEGTASSFNVPAALQDLPGDLRVLLGDSSFVSFCGPFDAQHRRTVGIRSASTPPLTLPNVAVNVKRMNWDTRSGSVTTVTSQR